MNHPEGLYYTKDHEWIRREGALATMGITDYAQSELGDIVYVDVPGSGTALRAGAEFGSVESVKTVSDLFAPVSGEVVEINAALAEAPQSVNEDPYEKGWILKMKPSDPAEFEALMSAVQYAAYLKDGAKH